MNTSPLLFQWLAPFMNAFFSWLRTWMLTEDVSMLNFLIALCLMFVFIRAVLLKG